MGTDVAFPTVTAHDLDDDDTVAPTALLVRQSAEDATLQLPVLDDGLGFCCTGHSILTQPRHVLPSMVRLSRRVAQRRRLQCQSFTREE